VPWLIVCVSILASLNSSHLLANESFTVNFGESAKAEKIGDLRPRVLALDKKPIPDVSVKYVMKRYRKLFETAQSPEVRIEALNRLNNLSASYGVSEKGLTVDPYVHADVVLDTYQKIVDSGDTYQRMDELLYQTAKATAFTGDILESIKRLELLVGLYPNSKLADEALLRLAEGYFDLADFNRARDYYAKLLKKSKAPRMRAYSNYKLAWAEYRLADNNDALQRLSNFFDAFPGIYSSLLTTDLTVIPFRTSSHRGFDIDLDKNILSDGMRLLALLNEQGDWMRNISETAIALGGPEREPIVLRALVDHYASKKRYFDAASLIAQYTDNATTDQELFFYNLKGIELYQQADRKIEAWKAKAALVQRFGIRSDFWKTAQARVKAEIRPSLIDVTEELAHLNFVRMQERKTRDQRMLRSAKQAASYYLQLSALEQMKNGASEQSHEATYLAAQALQRGGQASKASDLYERLAYNDASLDFKSDAAYSALISSEQALRKTLGHDNAIKSTQWADKQFELASRFIRTFSQDKRAPEVALAVSNFYQNQQQFDAMITLLTGYDRFIEASTEQRLTAELTRASVLYNKALDADAYTVAERAYRNVLSIAESDPEYSLNTKRKSTINAALANSLYKQGKKSGKSKRALDAYLKVYEEFPSDPLAPDALFNAASVAGSIEDWAQAVRTHRLFQVTFPKHELQATGLTQLIYALEQEALYIDAAESLFAQAKQQKAIDAALSAESAYKAARYFSENSVKEKATEAYEWVLKEHPKRYDIGIEALAFMFETSEVDSTHEKAYAVRIAEYVEDNELDTSRALTLGAQASLFLGEQQKARFTDMSLSQPFAKSLRAKTKQLDQCTVAYKRVVAFGVETYTEAARFAMADIYQILAHDIMLSERPKGLNALEQEQYDILLEEQAIPIEDEAIALHELNIKASPNHELSGWVKASYDALQELNPGMYKRPVTGADYATFDF